MKSYIFFLIILLTNIAFAQQSTVISKAQAGNTSILDAYFANTIKQELFKSMAKDVPIKIEDINGSPYLYDIFTSSTISDNRLDKNEAVYARYNIYNDVFEVKFEYTTDAPVYGFLKNPEFSIRYNKKTYNYLEFIDHDNNLINGYVEVLREYPNFTIYKRYYQILRMPKKAKTSLEQDIPAKLTTYNQYFIKNQGSSKLVELDLHRKKIINYLNDNHKKIAKDFIKANKIRFSDEEKDLIKLTDYLAKQ